MRRKLIKQGNDSHTITLPVKWVRELNLKEGSEIELTQDKDNLILSAQKNTIKKEITLDIDTEHEKNFAFLLYNAYRAGYSKITLRFKHKDMTSTVQPIIDEHFFDLDIIEKKDKVCTILTISEPNLEEYQFILKKLFFIIQTSLETIELSIKNKEPKKLDEITSLTAKYRKYDNFCKRYIQKNLRENEAFSSYSLLVQMLIIQTDFMRLKNYTKQASSQDIDFLIKLRMIYEEMYKAYFNADINALFEKTEEMNNLYLKAYEQKNITSFKAILIEVARVAYSLTGPMTGLSLQKN